MKKTIDQILCIDTCTFLDIASDIHHDNWRMIKELLHLNSDPHFQIYISEIVTDEWNKHKEEIRQESKKKITQSIKSIKDKIDYFDDADRDSINSAITNCITNRTSIERKINENFGLVQDLIEQSEILYYSDVGNNIKDLVIKNGILKKAPMHKKTSMADAIIFYSFYEKMKSVDKRKTKIYFVSSNSNDFCENNDIRSFHNDLREYADEVNMEYKSNIASFINELSNTSTINSAVVESVERYEPLDSIKQGGKFEVYKDSKGEYRFRLKAHNGQVIATGSNYKNKKIA